MSASAFRASLCICLVTFSLYRLSELDMSRAPKEEFGFWTGETKVRVAEILDTKFINISTIKPLQVPCLVIA